MDAHDREYELEMLHQAEEDEAEHLAAAEAEHLAKAEAEHLAATCKREGCDEPLPAGRHILCDRHEEEYAAKYDLRHYVPSDQVPPEVEYRRVAGRKVPLDELPSKADVL
jgi:hypothetical protein